MRQRGRKCRSPLPPRAWERALPTSPPSQSRGYFISLADVQITNSGTGTIFVSRLPPNPQPGRQPTFPRKGVQGAMSQWFAQSPREEAASPLVRTADLAAGLAGHTPASHHGSAASIRMCTLGFLPW